jgi:hypothetical protein
MMTATLNDMATNKQAEQGSRYLILGQLLHQTVQLVAGRRS